MRSLSFIFLFTASLTFAQSKKDSFKPKKKELEQYESYSVSDGLGGYILYLLPDSTLGINSFSDVGSGKLIYNIGSYKKRTDTVYFSEPLEITLPNSRTEFELNYLLRFEEVGNVSTLVPPELLNQYKEFKSNQLKNSLKEHSEEINLLDSLATSSKHPSFQKELSNLYLTLFYSSDLDIFVGKTDPNTR